MITSEKRLPTALIVKETLPAGAAARSNGDLKKEAGANRRELTVRLHIWLEMGDEMFFGTGRALLLTKIEEHGSLRKAAEDMGMSYRAAWGKIRKTEKVLGVKLIEQNGSKKEGHRLTGHGQLLRKLYLFWFHEVERCALQKAGEIFPWPAKSFKEIIRDADSQTQNLEVQG